MSSVFDDGDLYDPEYDANTSTFFTYNNSPRKWKTREGIVMNISDMTDNHLISAIRLMLKKGEQPYFLLEEYFRRYSS